MRKLFFSASALFICAWIQPAMAYIDPGSGSAIMSAIIGFFVAAGMVIKTYWYKIKSVFTGNKSPVKPEDSDINGSKSEGSGVD
jgi:hypothetical protein